MAGLCFVPPACIVAGILDACSRNVSQMRAPVEDFTNFAPQGQSIVDSLPHRF